MQTIPHLRTSTGPEGRRGFPAFTPLLLLVLFLGDQRVMADTYPCLIEPHLTADLSTAVEGVLESVEVRKGDRVEAKQVVARLESAVEQAMAEQARARVEMESAIRAREVALARHREKLDRAVKLSSQRFVSDDELDELQSAVDLAELELLTERDNKRLAEIELERALALLDQRVIRSPFNGVVIRRYLNPGEFAQAQPIVRIAQLDPLNIEAVLPGDVYGRVVVGMDARVRLVEPDARALKAKVTLVEQAIDAASGTFGIRIEVANADHAIPAGLECNVELIARPADLQRLR